MNSDNTEKFLGSDSEFNKVRIAIDNAKIAYCYDIFMTHDNVTKQQSSDEFWKRIGDWYGFKVTFLRDEGRSIETQRQDDK